MHNVVIYCMSDEKNKVKTTATFDMEWHKRSAGRKY